MPAIDETLLTSFIEAHEGDFNTRLSGIVSDVLRNKTNGTNAAPDEIVSFLRSPLRRFLSSDSSDIKKRYVHLFLLCIYWHESTLEFNESTYGDVFQKIKSLLFRNNKSDLISEIFSVISSIQEMMKERMSSAVQAEAVVSEGGDSKVIHSGKRFFTAVAGLRDVVADYVSPSKTLKPVLDLESDFLHESIEKELLTESREKSVGFDFTNGLALQHALNQEPQNKRLIFSKIQACLLDLNFKEQQSAYDDFVATLPDVVKKFGNIPLFLALSSNDIIVGFKEKLIGSKSLLEVEVVENVSAQEKLLELNQKISSITDIERVDSDRSKLGEIQTLFQAFFTVVDEQVREKFARDALVDEIQKSLPVFLKSKKEVLDKITPFLVNLFSVDNEKYKQYVHQLFPVVARLTLRKQDALDRSVIIAKIADDENLHRILDVFATDAVIGNILELQATQLKVQEKLCEPVRKLLQERIDFEEKKRQREQERLNLEQEKIALKQEKRRLFQEKKCKLKAELPDYIKNATGIVDSITAILATRDEEESEMFIKFFNELFLYKTSEDASDLLALSEWSDFYSNATNITLENLKACVSVARKNWFEKTVYALSAERINQSNKLINGSPNKQFNSAEAEMPKDIFGILEAVIKDKNLENTFVALYQKILALLTDSTVEFRTPEILQSIKENVGALFNVQKWNGYNNSINEAVILDLANVIEAVVKKCERRPIAEEEVTQAGEIQTSEAAENNSNISKQIKEHCFPLLCVLEKEEYKLSNPKLFDVELFDSSEELREQKKKDIFALKKNCLCITALKITEDLSDTASVDDPSKVLLSHLVTESKSKIESGSLSEHRNCFRRLLDWVLSSMTFSKSAIETPSTEAPESLDASQSSASQKTLPQCSYFSPKSLKRVTNSFTNYQTTHLNSTPSRST